MAKVETERKGRSFIVTINRPEVRNCVDGETAGLLFDAVESFRRDESLDVLVLTGAGELAFCSGADLKNIDSLVTRPGAEESGPMGISRITDISKATIAAISGYCLAGGLELACWCDFRIAAQCQLWCARPPLGRSSSRRGYPAPAQNRRTGQCAVSD